VGPGGADDAAPPRAGAAAFSHHEAPAPSNAERYCAWFADRAGDVVYFGQAAFWAGLRSSGGEDPARDFAIAGPRPIGRFDLRRESLLPSLDAGAPGARSGVWDVLAHPNGRLYFTTFFENGGYVDPASGRVVHFDAAGTGLNELAPGPDGAILVTRYATAEGGPGSVVVLDQAGEVLAEHRLVARRPGFQLAAKTAVLDSVRGDIWVNSDLLPAAGRGNDAPARGHGGTWGAQGHPTLVLDSQGRERARIDTLEIQNMAFDPAGTGYLALAENARLTLAILPATLREGDPRRALERARRVVLDEKYPRTLDFAQTLDVDPAGRVVLTRWSGHVHVLEPADGSEDLSLRSLRLPATEPNGLYYAAYLTNGRVCATWCAGVSVVCVPASTLAPGPAGRRPGASQPGPPPDEREAGRAQQLR
jgi:hypothetical protein